MKKSLLRQTFSLLLCAALAFTLLPSAALAAETVGDFIVEGGVSGTDFTFTGGVLAFIQPGAYTVSMKAGATIPTTNRIAAASSGTVNITLSGVRIDLSGIYSNSAFDIASGSAVSLNLAAGTSNEFKSGADKAGIRVPEGASLAVSGTGTLKANGGTFGAGIGGGDGENGGTVNITGGTVNATGGDDGAGIDGDNGGNGGAVSIGGGTLRAQGGCYAAGIGGGDGGYYFYGGDGGAVMITGGSVRAHKGTGDGWQKDIGWGDNLGESAAPGTLTNGAGQDVFLATVTLKDPAVPGSIGAAKIQSLTTDPALAYGTDGMVTDSDGKLYLYLPAGTLTKAAQTTDGGETATYTGEVDTQNNHSGLGALYLAAETSDFVVTGGTPGTDYTFVGSALKFTRPGAYTVSMKEGFPADKSTSNRIVVDAPTSTELNPVGITLNGVRIDASALTPLRSAVDIAPNSCVSLTLAAGTSNAFKSGAGKAGIHVPAGASLAIGAEAPEQVCLRRGAARVSAATRAAAAAIPAAAAGRS